MSDPSQPSPAAQRLIDAARRHFLAHGFRSVTMDDLAEELGVSKKTLYASFPTKTELVRAVITTKFQAIDAEMTGIIAKNDDVRAALAEVVQCVQRHTSEIQPAFIRDARREAPELFEEVQCRRREVIHRHFGKLLRDGRRDGVIRRDVPVPLMVEILLGAVQSIINPDKMVELKLTPSVAFPAIMKLFLQGAVVRKEAGES
jgi:AcrR family transcriptional regulator